MKHVLLYVGHIYKPFWTKTIYRVGRGGSKKVKIWPRMGLAYQNFSFGALWLLDPKWPSNCPWFIWVHFHDIINPVSWSDDLRSLVVQKITNKLLRRANVKQTKVVKRMSNLRIAKRGERQTVQHIFKNCQTYPIVSVSVLSLCLRVSVLVSEKNLGIGIVNSGLESYGIGICKYLKMGSGGLRPLYTKKCNFGPN